MGNFLLDIRTHQIVQDKALLDLTSSKLRQYYSSYKSICQSFSITISEYIQIFGPNEKSFFVFDTKRKGRIDSMQLFTGLIIFSNINYNQKIKFLFEIFDFNQQGYLTFQAVVFMITNICNSTFKIYGLSSTMHSKKVQSFFSQYFSIQSQIKLDKFIKWSRKIQQFYVYFTTIGHQFQAYQQVKQIDRFQTQQAKNKCIQYKIQKNIINLEDKQNYQEAQIHIKSKQQNRKEQFRINFQFDQKLLSSLELISQKNKTKTKSTQRQHQRELVQSYQEQAQFQDEQLDQNFNPTLSWLYGINLSMSFPLKYLKLHYNNSYNQIFIYTLNNIVVMYYPKINIQKYYLGHGSEITCFEISNNKKMIASGDSKGCKNSLPQIHIWKALDGQRLVKFANMHKGPIRALKWINNDRYLVSISQFSNWTINITDIITEENILSTYLTQPILDVLYCPSSKVQHPLFTTQYFIVYSHNSITYFYQPENSRQLQKVGKQGNHNHNQNQNILKNYVLTTYHIQLTPIISLAQSVLRRQLISAHNDGTIRIWDHELNLNEIIYKVDFKQNSIIKVQFLNNNDLMILLDQSIEIINISSSSLSTKNAVPFKIQIPKNLYNLIFIDIVLVSQTEILLLSLFGEVIKVQKLSQPYDLDIISFTKYYQIFSFSNMSDYCQAGEQYSYVTSGNLLYKINVDQHELSSLRIFEYEISSISGYGDYYAILTTNQSKYVYIIFEEKIVQKVKLINIVHDIKLTDSHLILCCQKKISFYVKSYDKYLNLQSKTIEFEQFNPIFLIQTQEPTKFIVITKQKQLFLIDIKNQTKQKIKTSLNIQQSYLQMLYPYSSNFPLLFYPKQNFICMGLNNGQVRVWNSIQSVRSQIQNYYRLVKHGSEVKKIKMVFYEDREQLVTIGTHDGMIVVYEHKQYLVGEYDGPQQLNTERNQKHENLFQQEIVYFENMLQKKQPHFLKDSQMQISIAQDHISNWITNVIQKIVYPQCKNYQTLALNWHKSSSSQKTSSNNNTNTNSNNNINNNNNKHVTISISHIFGFASQKIRNSVLYLHQHNNNTIQKNSYKLLNNYNIQQSYSSEEQKNFYNKFNFRSKKLLQIQQIHQNCKREIIFFVDCILILMKPQTKQQRFYTFHNYKVTAFQIHPNKSLVCSAQNTPFNPTIHIWNTTDLLMVRNIPSKHKTSINAIQFSKNGEIIVTLAQFKRVQNKTVNNLSSQPTNFFANNGENLQNCSIEVIDWKYSSSILHRVLPCEQTFTIKINPYNLKEICLAGKNFLQIYKITSTSLLCLQKLNPSQTITCLAYTSSLYGDQVQSDIITGNQSGFIGLYICGKYVLIKKAHESSINFVQIHELFNYKTVIVTGGQDFLVKVWDTKFQQITSLNIRDQLIIGKQVNEVLKFNFSPQSLDLYCCYSQKKSQQINEHIFLIGTRNGYIIEAKINNQYQGLKIIEQIKKSQTGKQKLNFNVSIVSSNSFSDLYNQFQLCENNLMITYSAAYPIIFLWTTVKKQIIKYFKLKGSPSTIRYDSNIKRLYVGYFKHSVIDSFKIVQQNLILQQQISIKSDVYPDLIQIGGVGCTFMAVSLTSQHSFSDQMAGSSNFNNMNNNFISIYQIKQNWKMSSDKKKQFQFKFKMQNKRNMCAYWMQFSSFTHQQMVVLYVDRKFKELQGTFTDQQTQKIYKNSEFVLWSLQQKKQIQYSNQEFIELNFCPFIKAQYITYQKLRINNEVNTSNKQVNKYPLICQMAQYNKYTIIGTTCGEILFINSDFFCNRQKNSSMSSSICKYYHLCSSSITKIVVDKNYLYIKSAKNCGVLKLQVKQDFLVNSNLKLKDQFNFKFTTQVLNKYLKQIYPKRKYIYQSRVNFNSKGQIIEQNNTNMKKIQSKEKISLQLVSIMGRNSIYKRNNIFVDLKNNIISHVGCNLIIFTKQKLKIGSSNNNTLNSQYRQRFIKPDTNPFSTFAQISALTSSEDRKILYVGTSQQNSKIIILDISTQTNFKQIVLNGVVSIKLLKVSQKKEHAIVYGVDSKGSYLILFLSLYQSQILGIYTFKFCDQQINDLNFIPNKQFSFITCGNNHMTEWRFDGLLNFQNYNLNNPPDFIQLNQKSEKDQFNHNNVIFYSVIFLKQTAITSGSDGYLYLWNDKKIIKKQNAHPKSAILCLYASKNSKIFASGAADGKVIIWQLSSTSIVQKVFQFSIYQGKQIRIPVKYHIQSVCISKNNIIVGTRSGDIFQFLCNDAQNQIDQKQIQELKKGPQSILSAYDDDHINSCSFNTSSERLFILTQSGLFSVFNIKTMEKLKQQKIDIGKSQIIKMIVCKYSPRIFFVLKNSIMVYYYLSQNKQQKSHKFRKGKQSHKPQQNSSIKQAFMSPNQKYLALLITSAQNQLYSIQLFDLATPQASFYNIFKIFQNIPIDTGIIDFSTDSGYLMHKIEQEQETIHNLITGDIINANSIQFQLDWAQDAKKITKSVRDISQSYSDQKMLKLVQVMDHSIIATDQMGSIRVFQYPFTPNKQPIKEGNTQETSYYRIYLQHLNEVYICVLSMNSNFLVTVGKEDRSLMIWKVNVQNEKI